MASLLTVSMTVGSIMPVYAEEVSEDAVMATQETGNSDAEVYGEAPQAENSWRYENGVPIEQEEPNEGIMPADTVYGTLHGIDVSEHNKKIDWEKVKASGIDFAILRCGYGSDYKSQDDKYWERNVSECERLGIPYGVYLYSYAKTEEMAASEAEHVLRLIKGRQLSYPVYLDMEDNSTLNTDFAAIASVFCKKIQEAGYETGVYASLYWWNNYLTDPVFSNWERWVAQYNVTCDYEGAYGMWQYTSKGKVDGIEGNVDMNYLIENDGENGELVVPTHFQDVNYGDWYYEAVSYVADNKIMTGLSNSVFGPGENLARAQLVTILHRHAGRPYAPYENRFPDIGEDEFYTNAVMWASSKDVQVATGYSDTGTFKPGNNITREELVTMLYRYAEYSKMDISQKADINSFPDAGHVSGFAKEAMQWGIAKKLIKGDKGYINPQGNANRAECATIIMRFMESVQ